MTLLLIGHREACLIVALLLGLAGNNPDGVWEAKLGSSALKVERDTILSFII